MRDRQNILEVAKASLDYMGFIFYRKSPRFVGENFEIPEMTVPTKKVGVFVNEDPNTIETLVRLHKLDFIQLHGEESIKECAKLKETSSVIKAFRIDDEFDFNKTKKFKNNVDLFLFDTKGKHYGGNGKSFNWLKLKEYDQDIPFLLSGGLTLEKLDQLQLLKGMNIHGLDLNSGVEVKPGMKDIQKIKILNAKLKQHEIPG